MITYIDKTKALEIAAQFLKQHFSIIHMDAVLEGGTWYVTAQIELYGDVMLENIRIDAMTGEFSAQMLSVKSRPKTLQPAPN